MAAFPYQHPCLIDSSSFLFPNTPTLLPGYENSNNKISGFLEDPNNSLPIFSQQYYYCAEESLQEVSSLNVSGTTTKVSLSNSSLMVTDQNQMKKRKSSSKLNSAQSNDTREVVEKGKKQRKNRGGDKKNEEKKNKVEEGGYIHVRARRGQATDSHSLAERVRREKISERMKMLQALVPGCDKVTGKAIMLDEIINYVQSLQNQVEFLSMKLASMNPLFYDFGAEMDSFMIKPEMMTNLEAEQQQKCSPNQLTTNPFIPPNSYHLLHSSPLLSLQQGQVPDILQQGNGQLSWDSNEHTQNIISQSGFTNNNLPSFQ